MFGAGPAYLFLLRHRLPAGMMRGGWEPWLSTMATNAAIAILAAMMIWLVGLGPFLLVHLPITLLAASIGVWLFYVQHQFEDTFWAHDEGWNFHEAALQGSSHYDLPRVLRWFTANIGVHHVHHLSSRIPYYRLPARAARSPAARRRRAADAAPEPPLRAQGPLGREETAAHLISRDGDRPIGCRAVVQINRLRTNVALLATASQSGQEARALKKRRLTRGALAGFTWGGACKSSGGSAKE